MDISSVAAEPFLDPIAENPQNPRYYTTSLDVFHQLHCLVKN